jgi:hypothetical protein
MKIVFNNIDEIPEHLRKDAVKDEANGTYTLEGDGANGILNKNKELVDLNKQYKAAADKWKELKDVDPDKAKKALEEMGKVEEERGKLQTAIQSAVQENAKTWEAKVKVVETEREQFKKSLEERIIDADLTSAVAAADGDPYFVVGALRGQVKTVFENGKYVARVVDDKGNARLNAKGEAMSLAELVESAKADKKFEKVFKAPAASGSGAQPGSGNNNNGGSGVAVKISMADAKDASKYREAMKLAGGDPQKIQVTE